MTITAKVKISGQLVADVPIAVGDGGKGDLVDTDLACDGRGRHYIPGSSLAGPMRSWVRHSLTNGEAIAKSLFGDRDNPGCLTVEDAPIVDTGGLAAWEIRSGITIDENSGTAEDQALYSRAILPKGSAFALEMELDVIDGAQDAKIALRSLLDALHDGKIRFGSSKTRGFGRMKLEPLQVDYYDFSKVDSRMEEFDRWLAGSPAVLKGLDALGDAADALDPNAQIYEISIAWSPISRIMVQSGHVGNETDSLTLMSGVAIDKILPVIPGSSIKGVLRSQARRILRTLFQDDPVVDATVDEMFGSTECSGRVFVDDVYPDRRPVSADLWGQEDKKTLDDLTTQEVHVAVDRFTGGASSGKLFNARPVKASVPWNPIRVVVDFSRPGSMTPLVGMALLELVARDMEEGLVPIGLGASRGLGEIQVTSRSGFPDVTEMGQAWEKFIGANGGGHNDV
jgi:CRISPR/Cas system CSM-associated protein Csm3 (group 7 of RAMP superfamily)